MRIASLAASTAAFPRPAGETLSKNLLFTEFDALTADLSVLDDPLEWSSFSRPDTERIDCWESNLQIEGMHCAACALTIERSLMSVPGVLQADVSAGSHRARVVWSSVAVQPSAWIRAVQAAGYRAVPANDTFVRERRLNESRKALWRLAVAGLCMMQVMMYAYPAYIAAPGDLTEEMEQLLRWASWVLTLPVIFFSCGPFFSSALRDALQRRVSMDLPVALGMLITFAVSTAGTFDRQGHFGREVYFDSLTMFVFFLLAGRWLELRLRDRTAGALDVLMNRMPDQVARLHPDGSFEQIPVRRLLPGDMVRVLPGETFPADGVLISGETTVDEALLTGESQPMARGAGSEVIAGSHNVSSVVMLRVDRTGKNTRFSQIVALMEAASTSKPPMARLADRVAKPFLIAVLLAAVLACAFWWARDPGHALMVAVAVLVVTCPCALSLATPAAMLAAAGRLAGSGVLVRKLDALEALAAVDTVVFDKTGTLTQDAMVLTATKLREGVSQTQALAMASALAQYSLHPVSKALVAASKMPGDVACWQAGDVAEVAGGGISGRVWRDDAVRDVEGHAATMRLGSAIFCGVIAPPSEAVQTFLCDQHGWVATFELSEDLRVDAGATVRALQCAGVAVHLLSGDSVDAAARVANQVGIVGFQGRCTPQDKLAFLRHEQQSGHAVAVVGDGLNDGPMLAGANVSFAFGQAVPLAQARADFVVLGADLGAIAASLLLARRTVCIVRQNLWWAALYNAVCVPLAVLGLLPAWLAGLGMAFSSLLVVLNALRLSKLVQPRHAEAN